MLFDLRARGRRRTVKVVYGGLAVLLFIGLVFLGVGSVGGGSFLENAGREGGGGGGKSFAARTAAAKKQVKKSPNDPAAWAALTEAQLREASSGENYSSATETYTAQGKQQLAQAARSWKRYLKLAGRHPSVRLARLMTSVAFSPAGLNDPLSAVHALQIVITGSPPSTTSSSARAALYSQLTQYAYLTGNFKLGESAMKKTLALLPKVKRPLVEAELEKFKSAIEKRLRSSHVSTSSLSTTSTSSAAAANSSSSTGAAKKPSTAATKKK
jgi:hypothetical protein